MLDAAARETIQKKNLANILKKLNAGGTLTAREQALVNGGSGEAGYALNLDALGTELGVDRRTLANAKKRHAKDYAARKSQLERADGRYPIAAWREFLDDHGVTGRGKAPDLEDERAIRLRREKLQLDKIEFELDQAKRKSLPIAEFEAALGVLLSNFRAALNAHPNRATGKIIGRVRAALLVSLRGALTPTVFGKVEDALNREGTIDFADVLEVLVNEKNLILRTLSQCDYLQPEGGDWEES